MMMESENTFHGDISATSNACRTSRWLVLLNTYVTRAHNRPTFHIYSYVKIVDMQMSKHILLFITCKTFYDVDI